MKEIERTYFKVKSGLDLRNVDFRSLQQRLIERLCEQVRNGQATERGLARSTGISQPHVHNMLKGVRMLTPESGDRFLRRLGWSLLDLVDPEEMLLHATLIVSRLSPKTELEVLSDRIGPGHRWPCYESAYERCAVECRLLSGVESPVVARLAHDPRLIPLLKEGDLVLLDRSAQAKWELSPAELYLVDVGGTAVVRWVRRGPSRLYLLAPDCENRPQDWQVLNAESGDIMERLAARVIPIA